MSVQGYKISLFLSNLGYAQFQNVSADNDTDELDSSTSLNDDFTFNDGFSDARGDLGTLSVEVDAIIKDARVRALLTLFVSGFRYPTVGYEIFDDDVEIYSGTGIYVRNNRLTASIPGGSRARMSFRSLQSGYSVGGSFAGG